ncbi:1-(5-phosphoribosyl)-5-[(5-phosphoribosylamino) methylideneamino] imidazole-4-carboxamide isomerase [Algimonas ampicilliniresistens]|uniref:1-(5-phosphoribosyl)-5-[(5-phosphoribosylamino)methylideneamino] imidazole-4-carboxamide isomerase n=1 Tax=Algimonas ampicilliniresistens TaxID=1298735 RepID=A0ABQ5V8E6_9PROT|nr:1-(5-phosphoribosyl)-5-[(5-phosphoribosylamino)methylideneamino]imidazole-4-carboxamide isomerase [Algimonas ampicilliniresistens]GLQ23322.1 1-(5-phosphoribosyl)-5-[(5-phosphoribosylamino) methylideneamino] imidazole-4-carboxamide isomerase [Algimonas ampicilliniresistens]
MIYPAIDLMDGKCVRLLKGSFDDKTQYEEDPLEVARGYARGGAEWMHVVDLDGAKNEELVQADLIGQLAQTVGLKVQVGGGIRDMVTVKRLLDAGVERVVIGSLAVKRPFMVKHWIEEFGPERIVLAFDVNIDESGVAYPAIKGWTETTTTPFFDVLDNYTASGLKTILVTDIGRDGAGTGGNTILYRKIIQTYPNLNLITSGGVGTLDHVRELKAFNPYGIVIGRALYEGHFTLNEAIAC